MDYTSRPCFCHMAGHWLSARRRSWLPASGRRSTVHDGALVSPTRIASEDAALSWLQKLLPPKIKREEPPPEPAPRVIEKLAAIQESDLTLTANFNFAPDDNNPERRRLHLSVGV